MILGHESLDSAASPPLDARSSHLRLTWVAFIEGWPPLLHAYQLHTLWNATRGLHGPESMVRNLEYERINKPAVGGTTVLLADDRGGVACMTHSVELMFIFGWFYDV